MNIQRTDTENVNLIKEGKKKKKKKKKIGIDEVIKHNEFINNSFLKSKI